jgi:hypothetical protein
MSENPYAPPQTHVDDVLPPQAEKVRPRQVVIAVQLAAVGYVLSLAVFALSWDYYSRLQPLTVAIVTQLFSFALTVWIYYKVYVGRNWARVTLLVFSILGALMVFNRLVVDIVAAAPVIAQVQMFVGLGINVAVLWLLFLSPGRTWFQRTARKTAAAA